MSKRPDALLLLDQGIPRDAAGLLREAGFACSHVGEAGMSTAADWEILNRASENGSIVATLDAGFHAILAVSGAEGPSVSRVRIQGLRALEIATLIQRVTIRFEAELAAGALITVKPKKTTCHRLPIGGKA